MNVIKFSHRYKKMPVVLNPTFVTGLEKANYYDLGQKYIEMDTETVDGQFYPLPKTDLLIIHLYTEGKDWQTIRRWTPQKEKYYRGLVGHEVEIKIVL